VEGGGIVDVGARLKDQSSDAERLRLEEAAVRALLKAKLPASTTSRSRQPAAA
jgi:hypothetical protein